MGGGEDMASPEQIAAWEAEEAGPIETWGDKWRATKAFFGAGPTSFLFGNYSYGYLCMPTWCPWKKANRGREPPFYTVNEYLPLTISVIMGLQHALAMVGGLVVPPLLVGAMANNVDTQRQLVNYAMILSGFFTLVHCVQSPLPFTKMVYGSGVLSCTGISFTFLTNTQSAIANLMGQGYTFDEAYGKCLGTMLVCCWVTVAMAFLPPRVIRRVFPPLVPGVVIFLIGAALLQSAFYNWGGGSFCGKNATGLPPKQISCQVPAANGTFVNGTCFAKPVIPMCNTNGAVQLNFGAPEYVGLGFVTFVILIVLELFGSPIMRNSQIIIALLGGYLVAGLVTYRGKHYVSTTAIKNSPAITFLWVKTFPFGFYAPAVLPYLVGFIICGVEVIGDVTATCEVSKIETAGPKLRRKIQGALLADGVNCFIGSLAMMMPVTTFAQNNGVINITRCASRIAGICCGLWLILLGIIAPIGAFFTSIPSCVLGGVTAFLFANVAVSGIKIIVLGDLNRRNRFILSMTIAAGLGTILVPGWSLNHLWPVTKSMSSGMHGFRDACIEILSSGYSLGFLVAIVLHLLLPLDDAPKGDITDVQKGLYDPTAPRHAEGDEPSYHKPVIADPMFRDDTAKPAKGLDMA